jgi:hypothetical protein
MHLKAAYHKRKQWKKHEKQINACVCIMYGCIPAPSVCKENVLGRSVGYKESKWREVGPLKSGDIIEDRLLSI